MFLHGDKFSSAINITYLLFKVPSEFDCSFEDLTQCKWESATSLDFDLKVLEIGNGPKQWDPETDYHGQGIWFYFWLNWKVVKVLVFLCNVNMLQLEFKSPNQCLQRYIVVEI